MPKYGRNPAHGLEPRGCIVCGSSFQPYRDSQTTCGIVCYKKSPAVRERENAYKRQPAVRAHRNETRANRYRPEDNRRQMLRRNYGITAEEYEDLLVKQDGRCAICGDLPGPNGRRSYSRLHVDHHHGTGNVRALLCGRCNQGLGFFLDDPERLLKAVGYLERHTNGTS